VIEAIFIGAAFVLLLIVLALAFVPTLRADFAEIVTAFIAFFFLLFGVRVMMSPFGPEGSFWLGDLFASLGLTYFWVTRKKQP
jgi:hypothetical protein